MEPTDEELYRRSQKGDRRAFADLYERRGPSLYRYALHLSGSHAAAEEVTHDVFLRLIRPDAGFDAARGLLEGYLYGTARNLSRPPTRASAAPMQLTNNRSHRTGRVPVPGAGRIHGQRRAGARDAQDRPVMGELPLY